MTRRRAGSSGIEVVWPGKYDAAGERHAAKPRAVDWRVRERHGAKVGDADELVHGDNLDVLERWCARFEGAVDLVYMDPPFSTGATFSVATRIGEGDRWIRTPAYDDSWPGGPGEFLAMLAPRIERVHRLLAPHGSLYVHVDPTIGHAVKLLVDEIFGAASFQREIVWRIGWVSGFKTRARNWIRNHDTILFWVKDPTKMRFHKVWVPHPPGYQRRAGTPARSPGIAVDDVWNAGPADLALSGSESLDSIQIKSFSREKTGYATQKNESLLRRILMASSAEGELVLDPFCGSGTTLAVAQAMGRRFLGCDRGYAAIQLARARLIGGARPVELITAESKPTGDREALGRRVHDRFGIGGALRVSTSTVTSLRPVGAVVAPAFAVPLPIGKGDGEIRVGPLPERPLLFKMDRDALARDDVVGIDAFAVLARVVIALRVRADAVHVEVRSYELQSATLADDLRAANPTLEDLVVELAVDATSDDGVLRPQFIGKTLSATVARERRRTI
ncbi:MAG TPA: site-specific DNA-methyltransferase, partial [Nannocystaceae bacterium]|nr:site-specific DNA-methyltransferase [Nannocystaceae bacterium]